MVNYLEGAGEGEDVVRVVVGGLPLSLEFVEGVGEFPDGFGEMLHVSGVEVFLAFWRLRLRGSVVQGGDVYQSGRVQRNGTSLRLSHSDFSTNPSERSSLMPSARTFGLILVMMP